MDARNPTGINQEITLAPGYGDVSKLHDLTMQAPLPSAAKPSSSVAPTVAPPAVQFAHQPPAPTPEIQAALMWAKIAQVPGASPLVVEYAQRAAKEAGLA